MENARTRKRSKFIPEWGYRTAYWPRETKWHATSSIYATNFKYVSSDIHKVNVDINRLVNLLPIYCLVCLNIVRGVFIDFLFFWKQLNSISLCILLELGLCEVVALYSILLLCCQLEGLSGVSSKMYLTGMVSFFRKL